MPNLLEARRREANGASAPVSVTAAPGGARPPVVPVSIGSLAGPPAHPAVDLLAALFSTAPPELYLEVRPLPTGLIPQELRFFRVRQLQRRGFDQALPVHLDGQANVYFGVCPRLEPGGKAVDVALSTCVWADLDNRLPSPWPERLPSPAALVETSPGRFQAYWLLAEPLRDLELLKSINRGLADLLDADRSATDVARVLRLPGFRNVKPEHPDRPVATLVELDPGCRYRLEDILPALPAVARQQRPARMAPGRSAGTFDPHRRGEDVPEAMKADVAEELQRRGATCYHDGRLAGPCPFPGHTGHSQHNFFFSPTSGQWWCFGEHHGGRDHDRVCASGGIWTLWAVLFPARAAPTPNDLSRSPTLGERHGRGEEARKSSHALYRPPGRATGPTGRRWRAGATTASNTP